MKRIKMSKKNIPELLIIREKELSIIEMVTSLSEQARRVRAVLFEKAEELYPKLKGWEFSIAWKSDEIYIKGKSPSVIKKYKKRIKEITNENNKIDKLPNL